MQSIRLAAEKYAGGVGIATYKESLSAMDKRFDENRTRISNLEKVVAEGAVRETEPHGELCNLYTYLNGHFVPGKLVMPADAIVPNRCHVITRGRHPPERLRCGFRVEVIPTPGEDAPPVIMENNGHENVAG